GSNHQGRAGNGGEALAYTPADDGVQTGQVGALVILRPALFDPAAQFGLLRAGEEQAAQALADGAHAQYARQAPAFGQLPAIGQGADLYFGTAVDHGKAAQQLRPVDTELEADHATHGDAHQMHIGQPQVFDQCGYVGGEAFHAVGFTRLAGAAVAAQIDGENAALLQQVGHLELPVLDEIGRAHV